MKEKNEIKIAEVKGRPMLHWIGKQPLETVKSFPAQLIETFNNDDTPRVPTFESLKDNWTNLLFHGDNKEILSTLLVNGFRGKVDLIYIDPPFDSGADYVRKVELRGHKEKLEGEEPSLIEQVQYTDIWANDNYLQFMYERLILLRELLSDKGSIYLHCDWHKSHHLRFLLDEVFGSENFRNEIIWCYSTMQTVKNKFAQKHDNIFCYSKSNIHIYNILYEDYPLDYQKRFKYQDDIGYFMIRSKTGQGDLTLDDEAKYPDSTYRQYMKEGSLPKDWWIIDMINSNSKDRLDYPTQKPEELIEKIIKSSSNSDSIVLDAFGGCGTTAAAAQKLGRKWIACDINKGAIQTTSKRLQSIIKKQISDSEKDKEKLDLEKSNTYYTSYAHYKINDYDMQTQHNELQLMAYEYLGIKRLPTDSFFDGLLGSELVKLIPFNHPLSLLDLQLVKNELDKRKDETRNIVLVSLGIELKVKKEIEDYNRLRPVNKIRAIELRTDKKYGAFFLHKPAQAEVEIAKTEDKGKVTIKDFISPTIIQRLQIDSKIFQAQIKDFRSQIDVVLIDTDYNGEVFNICISDVPAKKKDFIKGEYEFAIENKNSVIAVKIIDMLGEEVLIV